MNEKLIYTFSEALDLIKNGLKVARTGWNGKFMFIFLVPGSEFEVNRPPLLGVYPAGARIKYHAHIDMRTADGSIVPWLASQTDLLAEDWVVSVITTPRQTSVSSEPKTFSMSEALEHLRAGRRVARVTRADLTVFMTTHKNPDPEFNAGQDELRYHAKSELTTVPWKASPEDMAAKDWVVVS